MKEIKVDDYHKFIKIIKKEYEKQLVIYPNCPTTIGFSYCCDYKEFKDITDDFENTFHQMLQNSKEKWTLNEVKIEFLYSETQFPHRIFLDANFFRKQRIWLINIKINNKIFNDLKKSLKNNNIKYEISFVEKPYELII